jgi:hypothetical protein
MWSTKTDYSLRSQVYQRMRIYAGAYRVEKSSAFMVIDAMDWEK